MSKDQKHRVLVMTLHSLVWLILFSFPYLFSSDQSFDFKRMLERSWLPLLSYMLIFYVNYFVLIHNYLFSRKMLFYFGINLVLIALLVAFRFELRHYFMEPPIPRQGFQPGMVPPPLTFFIYMDAIAFIVPIAFAVALKTYERWVTTERERKEAVTANLTSELEQLKYQLQPHFFFNSLNNIYSLVDVSPEKAKTMIHSLSKLMRYLLHDANVHKISLKREIDFINKYIDLMEIRFSGNVTIERKFPEVDTDIQISPLLFISIVENAFKHGVSATKPSFIYFSIEVKNNQIYFTSKNSDYSKGNSDKSGSGIGLENMKKRLELLYKNQYFLTISNQEEQFIVQLVLENNV